MRTRWQEWVIVLAIIALGGAGVWTLWGDDLHRLWRPGDGESPEAQVPAEQAVPQSVAPPAGQAAGPF